MSIKVLDKALAVLAQFSEDDTDLSVTELADRLGMLKGQISKMLTSFRQAGLLTQDPETKRYSVGLVSFALGSRYINAHQLTRDAIPILRALVDRTGHGARFCLTHGNKVIYLYGIESPRLPSSGWRIGTWMPLYATAAGKAVASFFDDARLRSALGAVTMKRYTPNTISDRDALMSEIETVRARGYAVNRGELTVGLGVIAVPIFDHDRSPIGALSIVFPDHSVTEGDRAHIVSALHDSAATLSARAGCAVYPFGP